MPMDLDKSLPGVVIWIVKTNNDDTIRFLDHANTCATRNKGNVLFHEYIIKKNPSLVIEFIQYNNAEPFDPILLQCAVTDLVKSENKYWKLTAILCYWNPYTLNDGNLVLLSFGIEAGVTLRSIIGLPKTIQRGCMINLRNGKWIAPEIETVFPLIFEESKNGLPEVIKLDACNLLRPPINNKNKVKTVVGALQPTEAITDECNKYFEHDGITRVKIVDESSTDSCIKRTIEFPNLKWRHQIEIINPIHIIVRPFILSRPEVESKFNKYLNILIIDTPKYIWRPKVKKTGISLSTIQMTRTMGPLIVIIMVNRSLNQNSIGRHTPGMISLYIIMQQIGTNWKKGSKLVILIETSVSTYS